MSKIFETNFRNKSLRNLADNTLLSNTGAKFVDGRYGGAVKNVTGAIKIDKDVYCNLLSNSRYTIEFIVDLTIINTFFAFIDNRLFTAASGGLNIYTDSNNRLILNYSDTLGGNFVVTSGNNTLIKGINHIVICIDKTNNTTKCYNNSVNIIDTTFTDIVVSCLNDASLLSRGYVNDVFKGVKLYDLYLYNNTLTEDEIISQYNDFLKRRPLDSPKRFDYSEPTDLSNEEGLILAYNKNSFRTNPVSDLSGNGNNATKYGTQITKDGISFDGVDDYLDLDANITFNGENGFTEIYKFDREKLPTSNYSVLAYNDSYLGDYHVIIRNNTAQSIAIRTPISLISTSLINWKQGINTISFTYNGVSLIIYHNGAIAYNQETAIFNTTIKIESFGKKTSTSTIEGFNGAMQLIKIYNRALTGQEIKNHYNNHTSKIAFKEDWRDLNCDGNTVKPKQWQIVSGSFKGVEITSAISDLDIGDKYLQCTSNGVIKINYGTNTDCDAVIYFYDGSSWSKKEDTLANLISDNAWLSLSGTYLTFTMTTGQRLQLIKIKQGVEV